MTNVYRPVRGLVQTDVLTLSVPRVPSIKARNKSQANTRLCCGTYICSGSLNEVRSRDSGLSDEANIEYLQENLTHRKENLIISKYTK